MAISLRRKLYPRGGSYETTIPIQLLFDLNLDTPHDVIFEFDSENKKWYVWFEESKKTKKKKSKNTNSKN